jgi:peptidyl-prolyl cis-trans isomerase D
MSQKYNQEEESTIQKIQNKSGCLLLVIGIAMLAFVLTDLLGSGTAIFGSNTNSVGKIGGQDIDYNEYNNLYEQYITNLQASNPTMVIDEDIKKQYQDEAWNALVQQKLIEVQYDQLGLGVSAEELEEITIGSEIHPQLKRAFTNPETGEFDRARMIQYLTEDIQVNPEAKRNWLEFETGLIKDLIASKYNSLLTSAVFVTEQEVLTKNTKITENRTISYVGLDYSTIGDTTISVSDKEILEFAKSRGKQFEVEASRDIEYVSFNIAPSAEDTLKTQEFIAQSIPLFEETDNDSLFLIGKGSEIPYTGEFIARGTLPKFAEETVFAAEIGKVVGPFVSNGAFTVYKVVDESIDSVKSVKASHVVLRINGRTAQDTAETVAKARSILSDIRSGKISFEDAAMQNNYDGTGPNGGDLGWIREKADNRTPPEFMKEALRTPQGNYFITTTFLGVQIGKVTSNTSNRLVKVATLQQTVLPSTETDREIYRMAGEFQSKLAAKDKMFEEIAEEAGINKRIANNIKLDTRVVPGLNEATPLMRWVYEDDTKVGDFSDILEVDGKYVIASVTKIRKDGIPDASELRAEVEPLVINKKKAEILRPKVESAYDKKADPKAIAKELEVDVYEAIMVNFGTGTLPMVGPDMILIGAATGTPKDGNSGVIESKQGVYTVFVNDVISGNDEDLQRQLEDARNNANNVFAGLAAQALIKKGNVQDLRYKFFN